ncbi:MAG: flavin reductase family protein [Chloroflexota bacterium]
MKKVQQGPQTWLYPLPALLIGTVIDGTPNVMTAAWGSIANADPPMVSVAIRHSRHSHKAIAVDSHISVNVPSASQAVEVDYCGVESGSKADKIEKCGFTLFYGSLEKAPLIEQCPLNLECMIRNIVELSTHTLVVAEIMETYVSADCLTSGSPDITKIDPLIYMTGPSRIYVRSGDTLGQAFHAGLALK